MSRYSTCIKSIIEHVYGVGMVEFQNFMSTCWKCRACTEGENFQAGIAWDRMMPMGQCRYSTCIKSFKEHIYGVGTGEIQNSVTPFENAWPYAQKDKRWGKISQVRMTPMGLCRYSTCIKLIKEHIYGVRSGEIQNSVTPFENTWPYAQKCKRWGRISQLRMTPMGLCRYAKCIKSIKEHNCSV